MSTIVTKAIGILNYLLQSSGKNGSLEYVTLEVIFLKSWQKLQLKKLPLEIFCYAEFLFTVKRNQKITRYLFFDKK